ncbi:MAG: glycosyltransferase [Candidatus Woesebacteria bacterium]
MKSLKIALVHDYLREYGGAERVVEALHEMFPDAPLYTSFVDPEALGIHWQRFKNWNIKESSAARIPGIKKLYSPLRLLAAYFFEGFDFSDYDVVISSTNMYMAKAVLTNPHTLHISYIHTPPRSLYGYTTASNWKKNPITRIVGELINFRLRQIDYVTAQRPDVLVANSKEVKARIQKFYGRDSVVIYPPVEVKDDKTKGNGEYYLYVNRLAFAKHPEIAVRAATQLGIALKVVGKGAMAEELEKIAGKTVELMGAIDDISLAKLYQNAKALLYPVEDEDFGIVPVEAMMHGVPVIAHKSGGPMETVIDGKTGILFNSLSVEGLCDAVKQFESQKFDPEKIKTHAQKFSKARFQEEIEKLIEKEYTTRYGQKLSH